ncbi:phosphoribosylformylglycinamidine synthase I [Fimbriiglobus ruber]|uniref:Phosphoribosylformylglycinamidine synthase, glutamine amidotransferase subunit n=1 Tax=Fimbriiglobus ruber TaxID=1908690 RepID=A0A225DQ42_9BACT|nr:phosphoribosylformylglycinamidine synthase I [Fimbriiglobus ruber]OWK43233.1 Phosphoribosylformylglycinamidine synthase, glutamine amidotransferase subunit [Fimbriiglobus ruber]
MAAPNALILRAPGTNCDGETAFAFERAGAVVERIHINQLRESPKRLRQFQILVFPGGFSYGDDVGAGKILAAELRHFLADAVREFRDAEKLILGVCNGFQAMLKAGLLIPPDEDGPLATLAHNTHARFEDRWVHLAVAPNKCPFLKGISRMYVPVAHGEGNFICRKEWILKGLGQSGQIVLRYTTADGSAGGFPHNPNGSQDDVAGICDATGRVLGLMPHPERHVLPTQHPRWTREGLKLEGDGMQLFRNAVTFFDT